MPTKWTKEYMREYMRKYMQKYARTSRWTVEYRKAYLSRYRNSRNNAEYQKAMRKKYKSTTLHPLQLDSVPAKYFVQPGDSEGDIAHKKRLFYGWCMRNGFVFELLPGMKETRKYTHNKERYERGRQEKDKLTELNAEVERLLQERDAAGTSAIWCELNSRINNLRLQIKHLQNV